MYQSQQGLYSAPQPVTTSANPNEILYAVPPASSGPAICRLKPKRMSQLEMTGGAQDGLTYEVPRLSRA